jgi:hypothetical protein
MIAFLATLWALPGSLLGFLVGVVSDTSPIAEEDGVLHLRDNGGPGSPAGRFFRRFRFGAITLGEIVIYRDSEAYQALKAHELRHVSQWRLLGPLFPLVYGAASLLALLQGGHGYRDNALEVDARKHAGP